ncbi:MAG TPA: FTR1 family protein [Anaerolineae bacterium]
MVSALFITLREGLEAALVIGIVLGYLGKVGDRKSTLYAWAGTVAAALLSALLAIAMRVIGAELETPFEQIFEGTTMLLAVLVLTWMIFWMRYKARFIKTDLERKLLSVINTGQNWGVFLLAFFAVIREGVEMALFLAASAFAADGAGTLIGALLGLALAGAAGVLIYIYAVRLNLSLFFDVTSLFLIVFSAGLLAQGVHEFQEIGALPILLNPAWDLRSVLSNDSLPGSLLRSLFGYNDNPSILEVTTYLAYWIVVLQAVRWWTQRLGIQLVQKRA